MSFRRAMAAGGAWRERAACRGMDLATASAVFFPDSPVEVTAEAAALCTGCPVRTDCDAEARANPDTEGIWGGRNKGHRARLAGNYEAHASRAGAIQSSGSAANRARYERLRAELATTPPT